MMLSKSHHLTAVKCKCRNYVYTHARPSTKIPLTITNAKNPSHRFGCESNPTIPSLPPANDNNRFESDEARDQLVRLADELDAEIELIALPGRNCS